MKPRLPEKNKHTTKQPAKEVISNDDSLKWSNISIEKFSYAVLCAGALLLYGWTCTFDFGLDDNYVIDALSSVKNSPEGVLTIFKSTFAVSDYRPVSILSFWLERWISGQLTPGISHFINVILFCILLTRIYKFIMVSKFYDDTHQLYLFAFITCLIFLVHPNHVSVVANIKSRDSLLSMLFGIMSALQFVKLIDDKKWWRIIPVLFFISMGFLAKMDSYIFIITPLLVLFLFRKLPVKSILVFLLISFLLYNIVFELKANLLSDTLNHDLAKTALMDASRSPLIGNDSMVNRISLACITMLYYIKFLIVPWGYYFYYGYNQIPLLPLLHPLNLVVVLIYITIGIGCLYMFKRNRIYFFSFCFFLLAIAYATNIPVVVAGIVMDRYNFIPSLGFCLAFAAFITDYFKPVGLISILKNKWLILIVSIYSVCTLYRTSAWKNNLTLFNRDISHLENSVHANRFVSVAYIHKTLFEDQDNATKNQDMLLAELYADKALAISEKSPDVLEAKGICEIYKGNNKSAISYFNKAKTLDSNYLSAINYIGVAYRNLQNTDSAYFYFNYVMQREQTYSYAAENLLDLLINSNRINEADSIVILLNKRFPENPALTKKEVELIKIKKNNSIIYH